MSKKRIEWIDIVKAIGMFLIVMGHTLEVYTFSGFAKWIFAVHVPVFFVLSGYLFRAKPFKTVFQSGWRNLLLPYLATAVIVYLLSFLHPFFPNWFYQVDAREYFLRVLYGSGTNIDFFLDKTVHIQAIGAIWFLVAMFVGNVLFNGLVKLKEHVAKESVLVLTVFLMTVLGFYLTKKGIYLPWSLNAALVSQSFYYAGHLFRRVEAIDKGDWALALVGLGLWGLSAQSGFFYLNVASAAAPTLAVLGGIGGSYVLMFGAYKLCRWRSWRGLAYYGKMSLAVLCIHLIEMSATTSAGRFYHACLALGASQVVAVFSEIVYRTLITIIFIVILPHLPGLRSFYLNRRYPFRAKKV